MNDTFFIKRFCIEFNEQIVLALILKWPSFTDQQVFYLCKFPENVNPALQIRASQQSITANLPPLTAHIYHVMIIVTSDFSKKSFFYYYYFLKIIFNDLKLVFLVFKPHRANLFSFYIYSFLTPCFLIILCINALHLSVFSTACKYTEWVSFLFACFTMYINALYLLYFSHH